MSFEAPAELLDDCAREQTLDEIQGFGVTHVRALVYWRAVLRRPALQARSRRSTPSDPNAYPADTWGRLDHLVDSLARRHMTVAAHAHRPGPDVGDQARKDKVNDPEREAVRQAGCAPSRRATATA